MNALKRLRELTDQQASHLRASIPFGRESAVRAILHVQDQIPADNATAAVPDLITGRRLANPAGKKALQLCLEASDRPSLEPGAASAGELATWGTRFLADCAHLVEAEMVLAHCETGFMRVAENGNGTFDAWIATKLSPASWREREDIDWWASWLAERHAPELAALRAEEQDTDSNGHETEVRYRALADIHLKRMAYQFGYPASAVIGGYTAQTWTDILGVLIADTLRRRDRGDPDVPVTARSLIDKIASALNADAAMIGPAIKALTLDAENAAWHAAVPGVAAAPLVRIGADRLITSHHGLTTEPFLFLLRELRRRDPEGYHNAAQLREAVFRQELYALFEDKRFITSEAGIRLRHATGKLRTDIDAAVFDRKTGTLGVFELKSQDPFARSSAALKRQRDNLLYANRQVSGVLDWVNRYGGDEIVRRIDPRIAKTFRVHRVYPFVLARYLVHFNFNDGAKPDTRAAWGTWPGLLRVMYEHRIDNRDANPIASLFSNLRSSRPLAHGAASCGSCEMTLGTARVIVHPSHAAYQARGAEIRDA